MEGSNFLTIVLKKEVNFKSMIKAKNFKYVGLEFT